MHLECFKLSMFQDPGKTPIEASEYDVAPETVGEEETPSPDDNPHNVSMQTEQSGVSSVADKQDIERLNESIKGLRSHIDRVEGNFNQARDNFVPVKVSE